MHRSPLNLAVLVSGSGTTLQNFVDQMAVKNLHAQIRLVIGSRPDLLALTRAADAGLPRDVVDRKSFPDLAGFSRRVFDLVDAANVDLVCFAGWLCLVEIPPRWNDRIMN